MKDKICVVTGASSGIGRETALALARAGARVALVCRDRAKGERVVAEIARLGAPAADLFVADLSAQRSIRAVAAEIDEALPRVDVLVNNAGLIVGDRVLTEDGYE